jgi:PAS domain S-box-containing protein
MWPPNALLLGVLLLTPPRIWWFLLLSALPAHLLVELQSLVPFPMVLCWFLSNSAEALIGAVSIRLIAGPSTSFGQMRGMAALFLGAGLLAPVLSSFLDAAFVSLNHFGHQGYWEVWRMRLFSNIFTELMLVPAIVSWSAFRLTPPGFAPVRFLVEGSAIFLGLLIVSVMVFLCRNAGPTTSPALLYLPLPFMLWTAVRFGPNWTSIANLTVAFLAIWGAVHGRGPFTTGSPETNAFTIQAFFLVVSVTFMLLTISVMERGKAEERFAKVFRSSPDAMIVSNRESGRIIEVNGRWETMSGYLASESIGRTLSELNIYPSRSDSQKLLERTCGGGPVHDLELCLRAKEGDLRRVQISADTDEIGGKSCLITVIRDISDRERAEEAQQKLAHMSRLAVLGELTATIAHEVRQPLSAISANTEAAELLLASTAPDLDEVRRILSDIRQDDLRADEAIRRIRGLLTKRELQIQPLSLKEILSDALKLLASAARKRHVQVREELQPGLPLVLGDQFQLQQVLVNLIVNGMDAMNQTPEPNRRLTIKAAEDGATVRVTVIDRGQGIPPTHASRIFESFFTTKNEGMGLGLSIARSIIEDHGGRIWAENNPEDGAIFHFTIPAAEYITEGQNHSIRAALSS